MQSCAGGMHYKINVTGGFCLHPNPPWDVSLCVHYMSCSYSFPLTQEMAGPISQHKTHLNNQ